MFLSLWLFSYLALAESIPKAEYPCANQASYPVHLTFDDGPKMPETQIILDELKKRNIKATFFLSMSRLKGISNPGPETQKLLALIQRMKNEGHVVGSHSFEHIDHANLDQTSSAEAEDNLQASFAIAKKLKLTPPIPFRFPFGAGWFQNKNPADQTQASKMMNEIIEAGYAPTHWDIDTWDWSKIKRKALPESMLGQICSHRGGIVLMHDIQSFTAQNLGSLIDSIENSNHKIVSLQEIKKYSAHKKDGPLASLSPQTAGIFSCARSKGDFDQIWPSCKSYQNNSADLNPGINSAEGAQ